MSRARVLVKNRRSAPTLGNAWAMPDVLAHAVSQAARVAGRPDPGQGRGFTWIRRRGNRPECGRLLIRTYE